MSGFPDDARAVDVPAYHFICWGCLSGFNATERFPHGTTAGEETISFCDGCHPILAAYLEAEGIDPANPSRQIDIEVVFPALASPAKRLMRLQLGMLSVGPC